MDAGYGLSSATSDRSPTLRWEHQRSQVIHSRATGVASNSVFASGPNVSHNWIASNFLWGEEGPGYTDGDIHWDSECFILCVSKGKILSQCNNERKMRDKTHQFCLAGANQSCQNTMFWMNKTYLSICSGQFSGPWWQMHISDILISLLVTVFCEYKPINASRVHRLDRIITVSVTQWSVSRYNGLIAYKREVCVSQCLPRKIQIVRRAPNSISIIL